MENKEKLEIEKKWLDIKEVVKYYPLSLSMLYKHKMYGIPARKIGGKLVFKREELEEYLEQTG
ncbi:MAG: hypothetical protein Unbinned5081contig1003_39 [Prokaryotic dsDNA virus sp.]|nr:MAG: hypothetical protein Unbinned5081contig1003_39 [Prokaryotic dsDNA virus sp.]|tara:strand:- start:29703 stop:29891 length:189 start_codon:yes stop_codon:yes gene_type:complete